MMVQSCPSEQELAAFQLGGLADAALDEVARHLENCPRCDRLVQRFDAALDPVLAAIRREYAVPATYSFLAPAAQPDEIGRLGNYRVLRLLHQRSSAFVFEAEELATGRRLALKIMRPHLQPDSKGCQRFLQETRLLAGSHHDHLATVHQAGCQGGIVYVAMELLEGETLGSWREHGSGIELDEVLRLGREIAGGLAGLHRLGLIHGAVRPDNVWLALPERKVKILNFGLARFVHDDLPVTQEPIITEASAFMAPEQARGLEVDARSDLFSLGGILYWLCTGKPPFQGATTAALLIDLAFCTPPPIHELNPRIPTRLADLVMQMLSTDRVDRPASAAVVLASLRRCSFSWRGCFGGLLRGP